MKTIDIALDTLVPSEANVRRTGRDAGLDELAASIAAHGLLSALVVRRKDRSSDPARDGVAFEVIAGGRRHAALSKMAADEVIPPNFPVPCRVVRGDVDDDELSLAENEMRVPMHPADQIVAFRAMFDRGATVSQVASRFGYSEHHVRQRMRLAGVAPEIIDDYRNGEIGYDAVKAYAVTEDRDRQLQVRASMADKADWQRSPHQIRSALTKDDAISANSRLGQFVGLDAYEAAGGPVERDLFAHRAEHGEGIYLADPDLVSRMADEKLAAAAAELEDDWKWATPMQEFPWEIRPQFEKLEPEPDADLAKLLAEAQEKVDAHEAEVEDGLGEGDAWPEDEIARHEKLSEALAVIETQARESAEYTAAQRERAGVVVTIGGGGRVDLYPGLVAPEDQTPDEPEAADAGAPDGPAKEAPLYGKALAEDLAHIRTTFAKAHLRFRDAFDLLTFGMVQRRFGMSYKTPAVGFRMEASDPRTPRHRTNDEFWTKASPGEALIEAEYQALRGKLIEAGWLDDNDTSLPREGSQLYETFLSLDTATRNRLFTFCVAQGLAPQLSLGDPAFPEIEHVLAHAPPPWKQVRPTASMLWSRLSKKRLLEDFAPVLGDDWIAEHKALPKAKLVDAIEEAFAGRPGFVMPGFAAPLPGPAINEEEAE